MLLGSFDCNDDTVPVYRRPFLRGAAPLGLPVALLATEGGWQGIFPREVMLLSYFFPVRRPPHQLSSMRCVHLL